MKTSGKVIIKKWLWFVPFAILFILLIWGASNNLVWGKEITKTDTVRMVSMILMTGISLIWALLRKSLFNRICGIVVLVASAPCFFLLIEFYTHNPFKDSPVMKSGIMTLNILLIFTAIVALTMITTRVSAAVSIAAVVMGVFGFVNYLSMEFRAAPVYPWDIASAGTAISVLDNFDIVLTPKLFFIIFCFLFAICASILCDSSLYLKKWWIQLIAAVVTVGVFCGLFAYVRSDYAENKYGYYPYLYSEAYLYKYNGVAVTMTWTTKYLTVSKPDGYSLNEIKRLYEENRTEPSASETKPNVIVIMNEAFSDPAVLGLDFNVNKDYLPRIHELTENGDVKTGYVTVSVKGGNTPNSEYEFLTGMSMAFLPAGSIPYQQFISGDISNIVTQMEDIGYTTVGMHPYYSSGWKRDEVYPELGFDSILFSNSFKFKSKIRNYISDAALFQQISQLMRENGTGKPMFVFAVTMQNHSAYTTEYANFSSTVKVSGSTYKPLEQYLSLMAESDAAFADFISAIEQNTNEPTVVIMFGDHQPNDNVYAPIYRLNKCYEDLSSSDPETMLRRYMTPYIIWSNYGADFSSVPELTSLNYLGAQLLSSLELSLTPFQKWQLSVSESIPVLCAGGYYDGQWHNSENLDSTLLKTYSRIQYNYIFGKKSTLNEMFSIAK